MAGLVILEGPDGSGKTTLADKLLELGVVDQKRHVGPPRAGENLFKTYQVMLQTAPARTVFDRCFHGELVYGPTLRGQSLLTPAQARFLEFEAATRGAVMVWCDANLDVLRERAKGDWLIEDLELLPQLAARYEYVRSQSKLAGIVYDSSEHTIHFALEGINLLAGLVPVGGSCRSAVGGLRPQGVLVGDTLRPEVLKGAPEPHDRRWSKPPWIHLRPFESGPAADFLIECLYKIEGFTPYHVLLRNSRHPWLGPVKDLGRLKEALIEDHECGARITALGGQACQRLCQLNVPHQTIPHPSYWRRFHSTQPERYIQMLKEAIYGPKAT